MKFCKAHGVNHMAKKFKNGGRITKNNIGFFSEKYNGINFQIGDDLCYDVYYTFIKRNKVNVHDNEDNFTDEVY